MGTPLIDSALQCCFLLSAMSGRNIASPDSTGPEQGLRQSIQHYGKENNVAFILKRKWLSSAGKLAPLAFKSREGAFLLLLKFSASEATIGVPGVAHPWTIDKDELSEMWCGEVILLNS